jgi:large conductance mechanosensitive channel
MTPSARAVTAHRPPGMQGIDALLRGHYRRAPRGCPPPGRDGQDETSAGQPRSSAAMSFASEFKEFALKGNVMDLAVGVIIGGAFGKIVDSVVGDLIMPVVSKIFGGLDFSSYYLPLAGQDMGLPLAEAKKLGAVIAYGNFITVALNFAILALIIFIMIKQVNRLKREAPPAPPAPPPPTPEDVLLLREIRDALRK